MQWQETFRTDEIKTGDFTFETERKIRKTNLLIREYFSMRTQIRIKIYFVFVRESLEYSLNHNKYSGCDWLKHGHKKLYSLVTNNVLLYELFVAQL